MKKAQNKSVKGHLLNVLICFCFVGKQSLKHYTCVTTKNLTIKMKLGKKLWIVMFNSNR